MIDYQEIFNTDGISYNAYRELIDEKLAEGVTTGNKNSESLVSIYQVKCSPHGSFR